MNDLKKLDTAVFAAGCFWCYETLFERLKGVENVVSGYAGGHFPNPTDRDVYSGTTGHAECVQVTFDPQIISFEKLVEIFWTIHDPTSLNKQGYDVGEEYRSAIFYNSREQMEIAEKSKMEQDASGKYPNPIVTEIVPIEEFYPADDYHQNFYKNNPNKGYCSVIIGPKVKNFYEMYEGLLKEEELV